MIRAMTTAALLSATLLAAGCASLKPGAAPSDPAEARAATAAASAAVIETQRAALSNAMADTGVSVLRLTVRQHHGSTSAALAAPDGR